MNLAKRYSKTVDERFTRESQAVMALNNNYDFTGVDTVKVYSIPVVPMTDYKRSGLARYGAPDDLTRNVQTLKINKDRAFTFIIDKGDKIQSQMVSDAGRALQRQLSEVWVPEYDTYVFRTLADSAIANGAVDTTQATNANAYELFLKGMEALGNANVPDQGRVAFCSYRFANLLKRDSAFMKYGDASQQMLIKGVIGEVDGCKIVKVPASRLPVGAACIITHPIAATGPKQLEDYKIHDNPPGINGWLVEGRVIYDCFVLNQKAKAVYYIGGQQVLQPLNVITAATGTAESTIIVEPGVMTGTKRYFKTFAAAQAPMTYSSSAFTTTGYTEMKDSQNNAVPSGFVASSLTTTDTIIRVVEVDSNGVAIAYGDAPLNMG
jgi:N4-gp56 family major capsid protein